MREIRRLLEDCGVDDTNHANQGRPTQELAENTGIIRPEQLRLFTERDLNDAIIKGYNRDPDMNFKVTFGVMNNILIGRYWIVDQYNRGISILDGNSQVTGLTDNVMTLMRVQKAADDRLAKNVSTATLDPWDKKKIEFYKYVQTKLVPHLAQMVSATNGSMEHLVREDKPAGWDPETDARDEKEKRIYQLLLTGDKVTEDNTRFWYLCQTIFGHDDNHWRHFMTHDNTKDARAGFVALRAHENGQGETSLRVEQAKAIIKNPGTWRGEFGNNEMDSLITRLHMAYHTMESNGRTYEDRDKIDALDANIQQKEGSKMDVEMSTV